MDKNKLLGIELPQGKKKDILDKIKKYISSPSGFCHIVSLNPEIMVIASKNDDFKKVVLEAQITIVDGYGVVLAAQMLGIKVAERLTGVDLMEELIKVADKMRLRVMLIGGKQNLAESLADCYKSRFPKASFLGVTGITDIKNPKKIEEKRIFSIVADYRPQIVLVSFGSPDQELWIERHKDKLNNTVCAGVGGAFNYLSGKTPRAPKPIRQLGLEWLFRLATEPWRWKRQIRLFEFTKLVLEQKWRRT